MKPEYRPLISLTATAEQMGIFAAEAIRSVLIDKPDAVLGMPTGGTALHMYKALIELYRKGEIDFSQATFFNLDEYIGLPKDHPQSYHTYMQENFFRHVNAQPNSIHIPDGMASRLQCECENYEVQIQTKGGIDLMILGIGENGHIGFNEPGSLSGTKTRRVALSESTRQANARFFASLDDVPTHAITMGIQSILNCRKILLLASGTTKAAAIRNMLSKDIQKLYPATYLRYHPDCRLILDVAAYGPQRRHPPRKPQAPSSAL